MAQYGNVRRSGENVLKDDDDGDGRLCIDIDLALMSRTFVSDKAGVVLTCVEGVFTCTWRLFTCTERQFMCAERLFTYAMRLFTCAER